MGDAEVKRYFIQGEVPQRDWELALSVLGKFGISAYAAHEAPEGLEPANVVLEPGYVPYQLAEITSSEQYLSNEHLGEFWPEYRNSVKADGKTLNKHETLCWGINMLANPRRKNTHSRDSAQQTAKNAENLGLKVVRPRSLVGFSNTYAPHSYGLWDHKEYGDAVIEVGSFISSVRQLLTLPTEKRPDRISGTELKFLSALANKLEQQIQSASAGIQ